jgi:hypothetical protein
MRFYCIPIVCLCSVILATRASAQAPVARPAATTQAAAKWCRKVEHRPQQPKPGERVTVSATVAADVADVRLEYQIVEPGAYVELKEPAYAKGWVSVPMKQNGEAHVVEVPESVQKHRRLVRFRIVGKDKAGKPLVSPEVAANEAGSPNYGYFVYGGIPAWKGAIQPGSRDPKRREVVEFSPEALSKIQVYHLLGKRESIENATWNERAAGKEYKYTGTLVADGVVYDHVQYRARGGVWRYAMGKNMWKVNFASGERLKAKDDYGRRYAATWDKLNLRSLIQMGDYGRRGEHGLYESVGYRLFNMAGVPAPRTHWVHWRIIDGAEESPTDQYRGDFWGLYLAIENVDGRFLKEHDLPDGNLFKMFVGGGGELENQGEGRPADGSDLATFMNAYNRRDQSEQWWRANLDLPSYYSYRAILECIHHYDISDGKNYNYYQNPKTGRWHVFPWDLDLIWADHMYGSGDEPFKSRVLTKPVLALEYRNRLREIRDLLYNEDETGRLIDECAAIIGGTGGGATITEADRRKWDYHPAVAAAGHQGGVGRFYQAVPSRDFRGMVDQMKEYVATRGQWVDLALLQELKIPARPRATYAGAANYPAGALRFRSSPYKGTAAFAAVKWRIAEIAPATASSPGAYEISPVWESPELAEVAEVAIPENVVKPGRTYRVRVRMKDVTGRWSHWSAPIQFVAGRAAP